jgi:hypothetical protein
MAGMTGSLMPVGRGISITISTGAGNYVIQGRSTINFTVSGNANTVHFSDNQAHGVVEVRGNANMLVFRPGDIVVTLIIPGSNNTIWVPSGSTIAVTGIPPISNSVKTYTP